jgi:hypothetical protein
MSCNLMTFDTLQFAKKLTAAGITSQHAEAQAEAIKELVVDNLATKQDIITVKQELYSVKQELENAMREQELRIIIKLGGIIIGSMSMLLILMKLFRL